METLIGLVVIIVIWAVGKISLERKVDNYPISKVSMAKMGKDIADGVSVEERKRRMVQGKYDKDANHLF